MDKRFMVLLHTSFLREENLSDETVGLSPYGPFQLVHPSLDYQGNAFMGCDCYIERYHQSLKQNAALAKSPTQTVVTQTNHFFAALCAFVKLELLQSTTRLNHFALKTKLYVTALHSVFTHLRQLPSVSFAA
jgi:hypothetical protein